MREQPYHVGTQKQAGQKPPSTASKGHLKISLAANIFEEVKGNGEYTSLAEFYDDYVQA